MPTPSPNYIETNHWWFHWRCKPTGCVISPSDSWNASVNCHLLQNRLIWSLTICDPRLAAYKLLDFIQLHIAILQNQLWVVQPLLHWKTAQLFWHCSVKCFYRLFKYKKQQSWKLHWICTYTLLVSLTPTQSRAPIALSLNAVSILSSIMSTLISNEV